MYDTCQTVSKLGITKFVQTRKSRTFVSDQSKTRKTEMKTDNIRNNKNFTMSLRMGYKSNVLSSLF